MNHFYNTPLKKIGYIMIMALMLSLFIEVLPANAAAVADTATTSEDTAVTINVLANDTGYGNSVVSVTQPANGSVTFTSTNVTYTPNLNFNGNDNFQYTIADRRGRKSTATVTVTVTPVNDNPVAGNDNVTTTENSPVTVTVLSNDTDVDGDSLNVSQVSAAVYGTVVLNANNTVTYTPNSYFNGTDSFSYTIVDGKGGTASAVVSVTVTPVNYPPMAVNDTATTQEDTNVTVSVLPNDTDPDGDILLFSGVGPALHGTVMPNADGTLTYIPNANFNGLDSFSYTVSDGNGGTATGSVTVTVTPVNDPPTAVNDSATTQEDTSVNIAVLANDSDVDGDALTVTEVTYAVYGTVVLNADNTITYTTNPNFNGTDSFTYTIADGNGGTATATVTVSVTPVNDSPMAVNDTAITQEDTNVTVRVLANDTDPDGDTLLIAAVGSALNGTVLTNIDGTVTYIPNANFNGTDSFSYTVSDGNGGTATGSVTVTVTPVNDPPTAVNDSATTQEDTLVNIAVLVNDSDVDGDALNVTEVTYSSHGRAANNADNTITYAPNPNFNGIDTFNYTVNDGHGGTATATVMVIVTPVNDLPVAVNDSVYTSEDTPVNISVLANDSDIDGDTLTVTEVTYAVYGTVVINADNTITYTPNANFNGTDSFTYIINDGYGGTVTATVTINVIPVNDLPLAVDDSVYTPEDIPVNIAILANDSDVDGDALTVTEVTYAVYGTVVLNPDNTVTYTPKQYYNGTDSFTYTISDGNGGMASATVKVMISPVNNSPWAVSDSATTSEDTPVNIAVMANDYDVDGDTLTVAEVTYAVYGTVVLNTDNTITYTPNLNYNGTDSFSYTISDGHGGTATATVTVNVTPVNDPPVAVNDSVYTPEDTPVNIAVLANDSDIDGDILTVVAVTYSQNGRAIINADNTITYIPGLNYNGTDSFTYTISDGNGGIASATVNVDVTPVNDPPIAVDDSGVTSENTNVTLSVLTNDTDPEGDTLYLTGVGTALHGSALVNQDGTVTYIPNSGYFGPDSFTYTVSDGMGGMTIGTVSITVTPVNDPPSAMPDSATVQEDNSVVIAVLANDTDPDGDTLTVTGAAYPINGTVYINADNTLTYIPNLNFNGSDSFSYTVNDGNGGTATATVTVTILPVNDNPIALNDYVSMKKDTSSTINVISNDGDPENDALRVTAVTTPASGTAVINPDSTVTYTPNAGYLGIDSFDYTVSDGNGGTTTASVSVSVNDLSLTDLTIDPGQIKIGYSVFIYYTLPAKGYVSVSIYRQDGSLVKNLLNNVSKEPGKYFISWNGRDKTGAFVQDGNYRISLVCKDSPVGTIITQNDSYVLAASPPEVSFISISSDPFNPVLDGRTTINYSLSLNARVTIKIYNNQTAVRTLETQALKLLGNNSVTWDGRDDFGRPVKSATYKCLIEAVNSVVPEFRVIRSVELDVVN